MKTKYGISLPKRKGKRYVNRSIIITYNDGFAGRSFDEVKNINPELNGYEFEVNEEYQYLYSSNVQMDAPTFMVTMIDSDATGRRSYEVKPVPGPIK